MEYPLTDFRLAGFLLSRGIKFLKTEVLPNGDTVFVFDNTDNQAENMINEYPNSPEQRYDTSCKTMHNFISAVKRSKHIKRSK